MKENGGVGGAGERLTTERWERRHLYMCVYISIYKYNFFYEKRKYGSLFVLFQILCLCLLNCGCIEDFVKVAIFLPFREYTFRDKKIQ